MSLVVVVSGGPGAGKTTLAAPLAAELGLPLLAKDTIKEAMAVALRHQLDAGLHHDTWSRRLGAASFEILFGLIPEAAPVVAEAHWHPEHARPRLAAIGLPIVEVFCRCPVDLLRSRSASRAASGDRHWVHREDLPIPAPEPLALGPVLELDTTAPVDVAAVARWVQDQRHVS